MYTKIIKDKNTLQKGAIDMERIESWVMMSRKCHDMTFGSVQAQTRKRDSPSEFVQLVLQSLATKNIVRFKINFDIFFKEEKFSLGNRLLIELTNRIKSKGLR